MDLFVTVVQIAFEIYKLMLLAYILMGWIPQLRESSWGNTLKKLVPPFLEPFRRFVPAAGMIDFTPVIALFILYFAEVGLVYILHLSESIEFY